MKKLTMGILAHVDSGKTTFSESLLYACGSIRKAGRVDHGDSTLDTNEIERSRGITVFSKQAVLNLRDMQIYLLDTPGHVDFSPEAERVLQVLDCAVLIVSASEGVQSHTLTLWHLLKSYDIPTFIFINKMDLPTSDGQRVFERLKKELSSDCVNFEMPQRQLMEEIALRDEQAMDSYISQGCISDGIVSRAIFSRKIFPCFFGSALKLEGVEDLLTRLPALLPAPAWPEAFSARVFKITRDPQGQRLTHLRVTGGVLRVKDLIRGLYYPNPVLVRERKIEILRKWIRRLKLL